MTIRRQSPCTHSSIIFNNSHFRLSDTAIAGVSLTLDDEIQFMDVVDRMGLTEEVPMHQLNPIQYLAIAQKAAVRLRWTITAISNDAITCYTRINDYPTGEIVTITINAKKATLYSIPVNEYSSDETQQKANAMLFQQCMAQLVEEAEKANRNLHPMHREKYGALVISKSYVITPLIVYINTTVFIAMVIAGLSPLHPTAESLFVWGGNFRPAVVHGEWWRLVTYIFLHGGAMHLLMNTFALLYIGMFLEPLLGRFRFASAYVLTGVCAGLMSISVHTGSVGVGASGAIFGMYGVFGAMLTTRHIEKTMRKTMLRSILFFVVLNLLYGMHGNTDNAAHIGGLLSGLVMGYAYYPGIARHSSLNRQLVTTAVFISLVIFAGFMVARG